MIVLGIVGPPAGGKSTVASRLQELGATWINADLLARKVLESVEIQRKLIAHFGDRITSNDGIIDRSRLAALVFGDDDASLAALKYLESVVHPPTHQLILGQLKAASESGAFASILDVPLLFQSHWDLSCDEIWCVDSPKELRLQRAAGRGWDEGELDRREQRQTRIENKRRLSNVVIRNDQTLDDLTDTIDQLWSSLKQRQADYPLHTHCFGNRPGQPFDSSH